MSLLHSQSPGAVRPPNKGPGGEREPLHLIPCLYRVIHGGLESAALQLSIQVL